MKRSGSSWLRGMRPGKYSLSEKDMSVLDRLKHRLVVFECFQVLNIKDGHKIDKVKMGLCARAYYEFTRKEDGTHYAYHVEVGVTDKGYFKVSVLVFNGWGHRDEYMEGLTKLRVLVERQAKEIIQKKSL